MSDLLRRIIPKSKILEITLNRPKVLNSLNLEMCNEIIDILQKDVNSESNKNIINAFIVKGSGGKAFCAGGDVKSVWNDVKSLPAKAVGSGCPGTLHADFFRREYIMNYLLQSSLRPQISLWDGIVMGGGVGVSVLGEFRVASEKTLFAMPETAIGLFPDVASTAWLPHLPSGYGLYIGLTGCRLKAADLMHTKIATHYISSDRLSELEATLTETDIPDDPIDSRKRIKAVLDHIQDGVKPDPVNALIIPQTDLISRCFGGARSVEDIISLLQKEASQSHPAATKEWIETTLQTLSKLSPLSLKLTFAQLQRGKQLDVKSCLQMEFRMMMKCMSSHDSMEGIRSVLIDKDNKPLWQPNSLEAVTEDLLQPYFESLGEFDLQLDEF